MAKSTYLQWSSHISIALLRKRNNHGEAYLTNQYKNQLVMAQFSLAANEDILVILRFLRDVDDATSDRPRETDRRWVSTIAMSEEVKKRVDALWREPGRQPRAGRVRGHSNE